MAVTPTLNTTPTGPYSKSWNVVASADADTTCTITHGFPSAPAMVWIVFLNAVAYGKTWILGAITSTTITVSGISSTGSGTSVAQFQVLAMLPHSIID